MIGGAIRVSGKGREAAILIGQNSWRKAKKRVDWEIADFGKDWA
jgi:hypothetical protein